MRALVLVLIGCAIMLLTTGMGFLLGLMLGDAHSGAGTGATIGMFVCIYLAMEEL